MRNILFAAALAALACAAPAYAQSSGGGELHLAVDRYILTPYGPLRFETKQPRAEEAKAAYTIHPAWEVEEPDALFLREDLSSDTWLYYGFVSVPDNADWGYPQYHSLPFQTEEKLILGVHIKWSPSSSFRLRWS